MASFYFFNYILYVINIFSGFAILWAMINVHKREFENYASDNFLLFSIFIWISTVILIIIRSFNFRFQLFGLNIISLYEYMIIRPKWILETVIIIIGISILLKIVFFA
jgi:hypothetical protein